MITKLLHHLRSVAIGLTLALVAHGMAHAGLIRGSWDPMFGSFLPNLSWQVQAELNVPNACSNQTDGDYSTASGPCFGATVLGAWLRGFHTGLADPNDFFTIVGALPNPVYSTYGAFCDVALTGDPRCNGGPYQSYFGTISSIRIVQNQVVGFQTTSVPSVTALTHYLGTYYSTPDAAEANSFNLSFNVNGPDAVCGSCRSTFDPNNPFAFGPNDITADKTGLMQFLITYSSDDTSVPKFTDSNGNALGAVLDANGNYLGQATSISVPVPEPGTLALALAALTAVGWSRRRRV